MAKGSSKGSAFERSICTRLSEWWTADQLIPRTDIFWRTSGSGARATVRSKKFEDTHNQYGDVMAVDPVGSPLTDLLVVELKRGYSKLTPFDMSDRSQKAKVQGWEEWISKCIKSCSNSTIPYWMVISKRNQRQIMCSVCDEFLIDFAQNKYGRFEKDYFMEEVPYQVTRYNKIPVRVDGVDKKVSFCSYQLEDFLEMISAEDLRIFKRSLEEE